MTYPMLNSELHMRRLVIQKVIGEAVQEGNESYTADELGRMAIEALEAKDFEIIWIGANQ